MRNLVLLVGILYLFMSVFVPTAQVKIADNEMQKTKQTLNLASKVLVNSIDLEGVSYEVFSLGYFLDNEDLIQIDRNKLVTEFNDVLYKRNLDKDEFRRMQQKIPALVLTYGDRFYVAQRKVTLEAGGSPDDAKDQAVTYEWLPPMYYTTTDDLGRLIYLNIRDETSLTYSGGREIKLDNKNVRVGGKPLSKEVRDKVVIDNVNRVVQGVTFDPGNNTGGFKIAIKPAGFESLDTSAMTTVQKQGYYEELRHMNNFNVLDGITFFIVYASESEVYSGQGALKSKNYNAAGFTLSKRY